MAEIDKYQLQLHNNWWIRPELILEDGNIKEFEEQKYRWFPPFLKSVDLNEDVVLTLRGPRRVGKTTALKLLIKKLLLEEKKTPQAVFFYECDRIETFNQLYDLLLNYIEFAKPRVNHRLYIFLDEISFVPEWQRAIKSLVDEGKGKEVTFLLTGSNTLDLKFSGERLPGRRGRVFKPDLELFPLDFSQFIKLLAPGLLQKSPCEAALKDLPLLQKYFDEYLLTGGFLPAINQFYQRGFIPSYIYEIYMNWIEGDLHKSGRSEKIALRIIERLFTHLTTPVSLYKLAKESGLASHATVSDYLEILENMFVLFGNDFISISQRKVDYKKNRKYYFLDPLIYSTLAAEINGFSGDAFNYSQKTLLSPSFKPALAEMIVGATLKRYFPQLFYGKDKENEIDFIGKKEGVFSFYEVKYTDQARSEDLLKIQGILPQTKVTMVTKKVYSDENKQVLLVPLEVFLAFCGQFCLP